MGMEIFETNHKGGTASLSFNKKIKAEKIVKQVANAIASIDGVSVARDHANNIILVGNKTATDKALELVFALLGLHGSFRWTFDNEIWVFLKGGKSYEPSKFGWVADF